jgi:hypothetical protein
MCHDGITGKVFFGYCTGNTTICRDCITGTVILLVTVPEIQQCVLMNGGADCHVQRHEYGINSQPLAGTSHVLPRSYLLANNPPTAKTTIRLVAVFPH